MKIYNVGIDLKRAFTDVLRGIVQNEDVMFKTVISDDGKPIDYSTCNIIMIAVRMPDYTTEKTLEAINIQTANAKKGIVEFKLPKEFTEQEGVHQLQIAFFDKGNMVKTARFNYCVEDGLLLDEPSETEITSVEDLLKKASEALVTSQEISRAENARIAAEEARISNELERNGAEAFRNERELSRGRAEADRKEAENIRLEQEAERIESEADRCLNENARIAAEEARISNELERKDAEEARISNELERKDAEEARNERELSRGRAEADRKEAEDIRLENEAERIEAEAERYRNEEARIEAETERKEQIEKLLPADREPAKNSEKLITSGGVYEAIESHNTGEDTHADIREKLNTCFRYVEGYEDEIDSYTGNMFGIWYKINQPRDDFYLYWDYYYLFAIERSNGDLIQMKFCESGNGIYFRTGKAKVTESGKFTNEWSEWSRTLLSSEVDITPTENSTNLITSGGVYTAIGDIETSLENIIAKYGLGGEA